MNHFTNELRGYNMEKRTLMSDALDDMYNSQTKYYAGVGARKTPISICNKMVRIARTCEDRGYVLRSGGAEGADLAFEAGVTRNLKQIFYAKDISDNSHLMEIAALHHPNWEACVRSGPYVMKLMARNVLQILGNNLKIPVSAVICWTPNGDSSGGTGQAIRIANAHDIPVFDLGKSLTEDQRTKEWQRFINTMDNEL